MIYIHVPFCRSFCTYCDFYSEVVGKSIPSFLARNDGIPPLGTGDTDKKGHFCGDASRETALFERYTDDLCAEIRARRDEIAASHGVRTLYIGGGTPSVLPLECLRKIVETLAPVVAGRDDVSEADFASLYDEFTVEVNPEDIVERGPEYVRGLLELGVNRISMGVQSLDEGMLRWMNRRHSAAGARKAWRIISEVAAEAGQGYPRQTRATLGTVRGGTVSEANGGVEPQARRFAGIAPDRPDEAEGAPRQAYAPARPAQLARSIDLISGVPGMSMEMLEATVDEVLEWRPEHISAYQLSIEEGSALAGMIARRQVAELPDEECRAQYEMLCRKLAAAGYHHYEISNWALPGHEAIHNSAYWTRQPYAGLGPGAHSLEICHHDNPSAGGRERKTPKTCTTPEKNEGGCTKTAENVHDPQAGRACESWAEGKGIDAGAGIQIRKWNSKSLTGWKEEGREVLSAREIREEEVMLLARTDRGPIPERDWFIADEIVAGML